VNERPEIGGSYPRLYTLHSQKGGVGKTSIAIAIAAIETIFCAKKAVIIDADMTGTSLIDVFQNNSADVRYLNELILAAPAEFEQYTSILSGQKPAQGGLTSFMQELSRQGPYYMPGNPGLVEIKKVVPLISQEDFLGFFKRRLEDIIAAAVFEGFDVLVIDHSPGLFGLSTTSLDMALNLAEYMENNPPRMAKLMHMIKKEQPSIKSILVTTPDPADHRALLSSLSSVIEHKSLHQKSDIIGRALTLVNNKAMAKPDERFDARFAMQEIFESQEKIAPERRMPAWVKDALLARAKKTGAVACQFCERFDMNQIFSTVSALKNAGEEQPRPGMATWCREIGLSVDLFEPRTFARP
jgi:cellulose biosynthesis protein BcsQ